MKTHSKREWIAVSVAVIATVMLFFGNNVWNLFFGSSDSENRSDTLVTEDGSKKAPLTNISQVPGVEIYDLKEGTGEEAIPGKIISVHYIGTLSDGTKFDSSIDRGSPYSFQLGAGKVIPGWDVSIPGMKVGGIRKLVISPELAYGPNAVGKIPANSTLIFEVQLLEIKQ
jgi:FKBP-type peptidyl-prolyl cis-trans isomerase